MQNPYLSLFRHANPAGPNPSGFESYGFESRRQLHGGEENWNKAQRTSSCKRLGMNANDKGMTELKVLTPRSGEGEGDIEEEDVENGKLPEECLVDGREGKSGSITDLWRGPVEMKKELREQAETLLHEGHLKHQSNKKEWKESVERADPLRDPEEVYRVYKRRWFILMVVSLLNCSNTMSWIAFAPVANYVDEFYHFEGAANWLSLIFLVAAVPVAFVAMWSAGKFGLRSAILIAGWANGTGAVLRLVSSVPGFPKNGSFPCVMLGQVIAASAYPFIMFLPTKVAASWFPHNQRAIANTVAAMSNPLGVLFANLISPQLVQEVPHILLLNILTFVPSATACLLATIIVRTSEPKTAPTKSAAQKSLAFFPGMKKALTSRSFLLLFLALGGGMGMFNTLYTMMQQILCPKGYHNSFAGICCSLMIVGGLIGATVSGIIVDRTKRFEETMKISFSLAVLCGVIFVQLALKRNLKPAVAIICFLFGTLGLAAYPIGLELGAECTFPVAETTSTGLIVLGGQIQGAIFIAMITGLGTVMTGPERRFEACTIGEEDGKDVIEPKNLTLPLLIFCGVAVFVAVLFLIFFKPKYRRLKLERGETGPKTGTGDPTGQGTDQGLVGSNGAGAAETQTLTKEENGGPSREVAA